MKPLYINMDPFLCDMLDAAVPVSMEDVRKVYPDAAVTPMSDVVILCSECDKGRFEFLVESAKAQKEAALYCATCDGKMIALFW